MWKWDKYCQRKYHKHRNDDDEISNRYLKGPDAQVVGWVVKVDKCHI